MDSGEEWRQSCLAVLPLVRVSAIVKCVGESMEERKGNEIETITESDLAEEMFMHASIWRITSHVEFG